MYIIALKKPLPVDRTASPAKLFCTNNNVLRVVGVINKALATFFLLEAVATQFTTIILLF